ncbi:hypothetical protein DINM_000748 [Dirofilaria immitis]|nr:hypothetical protein [Dirofilaria immitis]
MAPYNTTQFLLEDHEKRTMPSDVSESIPGMAVYQRQSTGGFSPNHESGIIKLSIFVLLILKFADLTLFAIMLKKCDERIATTTYIHIHTRMCYAPFSIDSENLQRRADFHIVDLASHSVPEHCMFGFENCRNVKTAGNYDSNGNEARRICGTIGQSGSEMGGNTTDSASYSGAEDNEMERQFDADYDYVNMERISNMSKDQVVREYMHLEKINDKLADRVSLLQLENDKLKQLLMDHNISYEDVIPKIRRHSGTSISETGDVRKSLDVGLFSTVLLIVRDGGHRGRGTDGLQHFCLEIHLSLMQSVLSEPPPLADSLTCIFLAFKLL